MSSRGVCTPRVTRSRTAEGRFGASKVLAQADIQHLLLPLLDFPTFVALRQSSTEIRAAIQQVCEDLIQVLDRAASLYVSPRFTDGLHLIADHQPHIGCLLQTPILALVALDRYDDIIGSSYHLLQAHLSRQQKLAVSRSLRLAASLTPPSNRHGARYMLLHLSVRLGMFTESAAVLRELLQDAEQAVRGLQDTHRHEMEQPPATAAAHYTLAGFYTYHHRRPELSNALSKANEHLQAALRIQTRQLGPLHVATLCSQLVKAQVMLLENNCSGCGRLLTKQLDCCTRTLSGSHPLAAKMLAVMARLRLKQGNEVECEQLQQQVLSMRRAALGLHHEDTHRSAMDVYSRRRQYVMRESNDMNGYMEMASAMEVCFEMLVRTSLEEGGAQCYSLSKSLQGMGELIFQDLTVLARRGLWPREATLALLTSAADTAERLPPNPAATSAGTAADADEGVVAGTGHRREVVRRLRALREQLSVGTVWPPRHGTG